MTRCRDNWIERGRWVCSVVLMSAFGATIFGVAVADGHGSAWDVAHPARTHVTAHVTSIHQQAAKQVRPHTTAHARRPHATVHVAKSFSSHVSKSHRAPVHSKWTASSTASTPASRPAAQVQASAPKTTSRSSVPAHHSASSHRSHRSVHSHVRFTARDSFTAPATNGNSDSAAVSSALGAWTGASVEVSTTTDPTTTDPTTTDPTSTDPSTTSTTTPCPTSDSSTPTTDGTDPTTTSDPTNPDPSTTDPTSGDSNGCGSDQGDPGTANNGQSNTSPETGVTDQGGTGDTTSGQTGATDGSGSQSGCPSGSDQSYPGSGDAGTGDTTPVDGSTDNNGQSDQTGAVSSAGSTDCSAGRGSTPGGGLTTGSSAPPTGSDSPGSSDDGSDTGTSTGSGTSSLSVVSPTQNGSASTSTLTTQPVLTTSPTTIPTSPTTGSTLPTTPVTSPTTGTPTGTPTGTGSTPGFGSTNTGQISAGSFNGTPALVTGGATRGATGAVGGATLGALTPATSHVTLAAATTTHKAATHSAARSTSHPRSQQRGEPATKVLEHIVNRIPESVWIALAALAALAAGGLGAAYLSHRRVRQQAGAIAEVSAAALTDPLTGVLNRRGFTEAVERELARARRYDRPFVVAYVDVRGLKGVNDTEGHLAGDELLKGVATLLHASARADDVVGRLGGDELGILLPEQSAEGAEAVTNRIQALLPERRAEMGLGAPWGLTIGTAAFPQDGDSYDDLIATADRRLYEQRGIEIRRA
jgi:diguanylate cyclase (GGDEF)-like protein